MARRLLAGLALILALTAPSFADDLEQRVKRLEDQNQKMQKQLAQTRDENTKLRGQGLDQAVDHYLDMTEADAHANAIKTRKMAWLTIYGFLRLDLYYDDSRANNVIVPTTVLPETGANDDDDHFALDARLTRIGFLFDFGELGGSTVTGKLEIDFSNFPSGVPESRETPRIRLAQVDIKTGGITIRAGQDWDTVSPLNPSVNSQTLMWNAGNPGDRRPQLKIMFGGDGFTGTIGIGLTGAINNQDLDAGPGQPFPGAERDGFDSGLPHVQGRAAYSGDGWVEGKKFTVGGWGMVGWMETDNLFAGEDTFVLWIAGIDFFVPLTRQLGLKGEAWIGQNLGDFRGTSGQTIDTATGAEVEGWGGWIELVLRLEQMQIHAGYTVDDPDNPTVPAGGVTRNGAYYAGVIKWFANNFKIGVDVLYWETKYLGGIKGDMIRVDIYVQVDF